MFCPPVSVIIPAYNEEGAIARQVETVRQVLLAGGYQFEIMVVDDGSSDQTGREALKAEARLIKNIENLGYGASLKAGILAAKHDIIVIIDADGTYPPEEIPTLVADLEYADMVVGARIGEKVHVPLIRQPAKWFLRSAGRAHCRTTDPRFEFGSARLLS